MKTPFESGKKRMRKKKKYGVLYVSFKRDPGKKSVRNDVDFCMTCVKGVKGLPDRVIGVHNLSIERPLL